MGKRTSKNKGRSKQNRSDNIQGNKVGPVHVGLGVDTAVTYEKTILNSSMALIRVMKHVNNYTKLRKFELDKKAEIRDTLHRLHVMINIIKKKLPEYEDYKHPTKTLPEISEEPEEEVVEKPATYVPSSLERELLELKEKLGTLK